MGAQGTATVDFGAFPGASDASVSVTGQAAILAASHLAEAWLIPVATPDHSADEHLVEKLRVVAGPITDGVGFTIYAFAPDGAAGGDALPLELARAGSGALKNYQPRGGAGMAYGQWSVAWVWN